jgi:glutamate-1-semialdehyde 2,1-aminomutase
MRVGLVTLAHMAAEKGWATLETRTAAFVDRLRAGFQRVAPELDVRQHTSIFWIHTKSADVLRRPDRIPASHAPWYSRFFHAALARGVYLPPSPYEVGFLSLAHDDAVLTTAADILVDAATAAV